MSEKIDFNEGWRPIDHPDGFSWPPVIPNPYPCPPGNEESKEAFNEDIARKAFGDKYIDDLIISQTIKNEIFFRGDWFQLAFLLRSHKNLLPENRIDKKTNACDCPFCSENWIVDKIFGITCKSKLLHLESAYLVGISFDCANLRNAHLEHAKLHYTSLRKVDLHDACLEDAMLDHAHLENAKLIRTCLEYCYLNGAHLENAELTGACLAHADLRATIFDSADVRGAVGIVFDSNPVKRLKIEGNAPDPWSVLRGTYTGPWFFFHVLMLIVFLLPFASKAVFLTSEAEAVSRVEGLMEKTSTKLDEKQTKLLAPIKESWSAFYVKWNEVPKVRAVWVLLGFTHPGAWGIAFFLFSLTMIFYNFMRGFLTTQVSMLRDAEERSQITPAKDEYYSRRKEVAKPIHRNLGINILRLCHINLYQLHLIASWLGIVSYSAFVIRIGHWIWTTQVPVFFRS